MHRIVFLDRSTLPAQINIPKLKHKHRWLEYDKTEPELVLERCHNANIIISNKVPITKQVIEHCDHLQHVAVAATGVNHIDISTCNKNNISVSNIRSYASISVPEHVISLALSLRRSLIQYRDQVIQGRWQTSPHFCLFDVPIHDLHSTTFGIIGFGELGQATASLAKALGMNVIFFSPSKKQSNIAQQVSFSELLKTADIISCHCPLNEYTKNMISYDEIAMMQPHTIVINTARGGIINEQALANAIEHKLIAGAGVDVLSEEPPSNDSPLLRIANNNNVILTPHIAWASDNAMQTLANQIIDNISGFIDNKPQNIININL